MISHRNVIANVLQMYTYEKPYRDSLIKSGKAADTETVLGLLPQSHIYSLVVVSHSHPYRGDQIINLPKFEFQQYLQSIQRFRINTLYLVRRLKMHRSKPPLTCFFLRSLLSSSL